MKRTYFFKNFSVKNFFTIVTILLLLCSASVVYANNIDVKYEPKIDFENGKNEFGSPILDFDFIYKVVENLSNVVKKYPKGREFGTPGEEYARKLVLAWMEEAGLSNIHTERIIGEWTKDDTWENPYNTLFDPGFYSDGWIGDLDVKKNFTKWYLNIKIIKKDTDELFCQRNFSVGTSFPFLKEDVEGQSHNVTIQNVRVFDDFKLLNPDGIVIIECDWRDPYGWWTSNLTNLKRNNVKGFILVNCHDETFFMMPSGTSSPTVKRFSKPGFSINGSSGKWIKQYLDDSNYVVKADFCSEWEYEKVECYNVIGDIPGKSSKIAILNAFYDGWWNQATFDMATGVGTILGIAKYITDNDIQPELTLRFISWGGHEWYWRGAKHYLKTHNIKKYGELKQIDYPEDYEDIIYVISPSSYGFNATYPLYINVGHERDKHFQKYVQDIARDIKFTERTGIDITGSYDVYGPETYEFYHSNRFPERFCKHAIEFDRWPYPGYHRDGANHTKGDVFSDLNDTLYRVDCELIAETTLRLTVPKLSVNITRPLEKSFYFCNYRLFSLPSSTLIIGPIDITVDINNESEIERIEFYIDNKLKKTLDTEPYSYRCRIPVLFAHTIKVVAYDKDGCYAEDEILVR